MKFDEVCVLLPCHSLEDFPTHAEGTSAEGLLGAWSALWHPALLASTGRLPAWHRADGPPDALAGRLFVIPPSSEPLLLAGWASRVAAEGGHVVRKLHRRDEIVAAALAGLDAAPTNLDPELVADFLALGFGYLAVELLTRQMRYMSNIDEVHLQNEAIAAAEACVAGDAETTRTHLKNSFEVLVEARERFYPVEAYLIDLTLVAPTTVGASLVRQLDQDGPQNLLLSGTTLAHLAATAPESLAKLRQSLDHASVSLVGGEREERELPLLPLEEVLAELRAGGALFEQLVGRRPKIFGRRRAGLSPVLPQILSRLGYLGALHFTLDDGRFATTSQSKTAWEGLDHSAIDTLGRLPQDANRADTFLSLPRTLGESMDRDHVATVVLAHWPSQASIFLGDLRRMAAYGAVLGRFITLDDYFTHTTRPGELTKFKSDGYRAPYLQQAVAQKDPRPLSAIRQQHLANALRAGAASLDTLADLVGAAGAKSPAEPATTHATLEALAAEQTQAAARLSTALAPRGTEQSPGLVILNPLSFARRAVIDVTELGSLPATSGHVIATQEFSGRRTAVIDVPGMSFCHLAGAISETAPAKRKAPKPIAAENRLTNELMRVEISPTTGGVHAIYDLVQRGNRLSSHLALRTPPPRPKPGDLWRDPDLGADYSRMVAESVEVINTGPAVGEIVSRGQLLDSAGRRLAGFVQRFELAVGSRVLVIDVELEVDQLPEGDPWESYYCMRFAWPDDGAEIYRDASLARQLTEAKRIEAPHYVEVRSTRSRTAILGGGLPYHRRSGPRMLDTLLVAGGETNRRFRLGVGVEVAYPAEAALALLNPPCAVAAGVSPAAAGTANWLMHLDVHNVVATHWSTLRDADKVVGFRVRLLETEGRAGRVKLRALRDVETARQVDFNGQTLVELLVAADSVTIDISAFEWIEVEVQFRA